MMRPPERVPMLGVLLASLVFAASCGSDSTADSGTTTTTVAATVTTAATTTTTVGSFLVGQRRLDLVDDARGRPLPSTVWYPARTAGDDALPAVGPFPVVVFSHGLGEMPDNFEGLISGWVRAGMVVVAPTYPNTSGEAAAPDAGDVANQPADASFVLDAVLDLSTTAGDLLEGALDPERLAAVGHGAGGATTLGLFAACCRDPRLAAGIVLAGSDPGAAEPYEGSEAAILYLHGDTDLVVPIALGRAAFDANPWPKAFITLTGDGHIDPYVEPFAASYALVQRATTDFLLWALLSDTDSLTDLRASVDDVGAAASLDDQLG